MNPIIKSNQEDSLSEPYNPTYPQVGSFNLPKDHININVCSEHNDDPEALMDILATQFAELWLTEKGFGFIPGLLPALIRTIQQIEAKARIIEPIRKICL